MLKTANVEVGIRVGSGGYGLPSREEAKSYPGPDWCRDYVDARGRSWDDVRAAIDFERELLAKHAAVQGDFEADEDDVIAESELIGPFDLGVGSTVIALSALGCVPYSSCNGGLLGGGHQYDRPQVVFYTTQRLVPALAASAKAAGVGLEDYCGGLIVYSADLFNMVQFAEGLMAWKQARGRGGSRTAREKK